MHVAIASQPGRCMSKAHGHTNEQGQAWVGQATTGLPRRPGRCCRIARTADAGQSGREYAHCWQILRQESRHRRCRRLLHKGIYLTGDQLCQKHDADVLNGMRSIGSLSPQHRRVANHSRTTSPLPSASISTHAMAQADAVPVGQCHGDCWQSRPLAAGESQRTHILRQVLLSEAG